MVAAGAPRFCVLVNELTPVLKCRNPGTRRDSKMSDEHDSSPAFAVPEFIVFFNEELDISNPLLTIQQKLSNVDKKIIPASVYPKTIIESRFEALVANVMWDAVIDFMRPSFTNLQALNLSGTGVNSLKAIQMPSLVLTSLTLSHNKLVSLHGIEAAPKLVHLDISFNAITSIKDVAKLSMLKHLDASHNNISFKQMQAGLIENVTLETLEFRENPGAGCSRYLHMLRLLLPNLTRLDGGALTGPVEKPREMKDALQNFDAMQSIESRTLRLYNTGGLNGANLTSVCLDKCNISDLNILPDECVPAPTSSSTEILTLNSRLVNVTFLSLRHNFIESVEPLAKFTKLSELDLTDNFLTSMRNITLPSLIKLDVSKNRFDRIDSFVYLTNLMSLVMDSNYVDSIRGLAKLTNLMELCTLINDS